MHLDQHIWNWQLLPLHFTSNSNQMPPVHKQAIQTLFIELIFPSAIDKQDLVAAIFYAYDLPSILPLILPSILPLILPSILLEHWSHIETLNLKMICVVQKVDGKSEEGGSQDK